MMAADVLRDVVAFLGLAILAVGLGLLATWLGISVFGGGLVYFALAWMDGRKEATKPKPPTPAATLVIPGQDTGAGSWI